MTDSAPLFVGSRPGTLKLVVLLALAIMLMLADRQRGFLGAMRERALALLAPVYELSALPGELAAEARFAVTARQALANENAALRAALLAAQNELYQRRAAVAEAQRTLAQLNRAQQDALAGTLLRIVDIDLDPFRQRLLLDGGSELGLSRGDGLIDVAGVVGQLSEVGSRYSFAILITDPNHALPVEVSRSGVKAIAYGSGDAQRLELRNLPPNADIEVGDRLLTTAVGGRFVAGYPVADVIAVERPVDAAFATAIARPVSLLARNRELLAVKPRPIVGPPSEQGQTP